MGTRKIGSIDLQTGELVQGMLVWVPKTQRRTDFFMTFQDALGTLSKDPEMTGQGFRVFMYLCSRLDFENFIQVPQTEIAEQLGIGKDRVSKAIKLLVDKGIIARGKVGRNSVFQLNPYYAWKGRESNMRKARAKHLRLIRNKQTEQAT